VIIFSDSMGQLRRISTGSAPQNTDFLVAPHRAKALISGKRDHGLKAGLIHVTGPQPCKGPWNREGNPVEISRSLFSLDRLLLPNNSNITIYKILRI
jgi:hypothetical protein